MKRQLTFLWLPLETCVLVKLIIYHCDGERLWTTDMSDPNKDYNKTLYFAKQICHI